MKHLSLYLFLVLFTLQTPLLAEDSSNYITKKKESKNITNKNEESKYITKKKEGKYITKKNTTSITDGYVTGIEPGTNFPNPRSYEGENDRFVRLPPHGKVSYDLDITLHDGAESVDTAEAGIRSLQAAPAKVFDKPQPGWCAD